MEWLEHLSPWLIALIGLAIFFLAVGFGMLAYSIAHVRQTIHNDMIDWGLD